MIKLSFDAPLMSFGGPAVDQVGNTFQFPPKSMVTGLLGAALGYERSEHRKLQNLQNGFGYGVREDRPGDMIEDFQTVDLRTPWMTGMWKDGTYRTGDEVRETEKRREILRKQYIADAIYTVVLDPTDLAEDVLLDALRRPNWPLYIGRKSCGAGPMRPEHVEYETVRGALRGIALHPDAKMQAQYRIWTEGGRKRSIYGLRDWESRIHGGKQWVEEETIERTTS